MPNVKMNIPEESKVGKKLSDLTTKRLIIVVLVMLFSITIFDYTTYLTPPDANIFGLQLLASYPENSLEFNISLEVYVTQAVNLQSPLVLLISGDTNWSSPTTNASELRSNEQSI